MDPAYLGILLIVAGLCVIVVELFVPSAGILGIIAGSLLLAGVILSFVHDVVFGSFVLIGLTILLPFLFVALVKVWPRTPLGKAILLDDLGHDVLPETEVDSLVGQIGVARTKMLPSGMIEIDGEKYDAVSEGFAIGPGDTVKVISVKGNRLYVEPFEGNPETATGDVPAADQDAFSTPLEELGIDEDLYE